MIKGIKEYYRALINPKFAPTAIRVALIVGTILFAINHGATLVEGKMTRQRWISSILTYLVPYGVSIHGQLRNQQQQNISHNLNSVQ